VRQTWLLLVSSAFIGLVLTVASAWVLLEKMQPPLEAELVKRSLALCRAKAIEAQYAATVGDPRLAERALEELAVEPSAEVVGATLVGAGGSVLATFAAPGAPAPAPAPGEAAVAGATVASHRFLGKGRQALEVVCPVEAVGEEARGAVSPHPAAGALRLVVSGLEVRQTVSRGFRGALLPMAAVAFLAVFLQLAIALRVVGRLRDAVRDLRQARDRLFQADKLAAVGTLAAGVAHEINNPLSYAVSNLSFVREEIARGATRDLDPEVLPALEETQEGLDRVRAIVRDLKSLSRAGDDQQGPVDLGAVLEAAAKLAWNEIRHRALLVKDVGPLLPVRANEGRLVQVFLNLLVNAAQAIPEGHADANRIRIEARMGPDRRAAVTVSDTGTGIAPQHLGRLFDPFFTTKPVGVGTGLGLAVCHGIVSALGGEVTVETALGKGSSFRVVLPCTEEEPRPEPRPGPGPGAGRRGRILVVDDEGAVSRSIHRLLSSEHEVISTASAGEALAWIGSGRAFDVVLCDVMMPHMTGAELYQEIARTRPALAERVVFITGGAFTSGTREFLARCANACLEKPIDPRALAAAVRSLVDRSGPQGSGAARAAPRAPQP
jgi:signal transduction histidine kinase/CheY-like chemotaxis protein